jgi:hypothetical protein
VSDALVESGLLSRTEIDEALELYENPAFVDYSAGLVAAWGRRRTNQVRAASTNSANQISA